MIDKIKSLLTKTYIKLQERTHEGRLKYLFQKNHSDTLVIVFSGFADCPMYNYVRTLKKLRLIRYLFLMILVVRVVIIGMIMEITHR